MLPIHENYSSYVPPKRFRKTVERLLESVPAGHLLGLESVVLTNSSALGRGKTKRIRGRKYPEKACLGFYHRSSSESGPWIELVVDNIVGSAPGVFMQWRFLRELIVSSTLYHEIGHHLEGTVGSMSRAGEQAADDWAKRLRRAHFQKRHRILTGVLSLLTRTFRPHIDSKIKEAKKALRSNRAV